MLSGTLRISIGPGRLRTSARRPVAKRSTTQEMPSESTRRESIQTGEVFPWTASLPNTRALSIVNVNVTSFPSE